MVTGEADGVARRGLGCYWSDSTTFFPFGAPFVTQATFPMPQAPSLPTGSA